MAELVLALDQGTTSSRALVVDRDGKLRGRGKQEFPQLFPRPGWVEHDPEAIWESQLAAARAALRDAQATAAEVAAIGIANQRETTLVWKRASNRPIANAIVWQCRRTAPMCERLARAPFARTVRRRTGLVVDAYFSATKIRWLLDHVPGARRRAARGELAFGTVDSWLAWKLTHGRAHVTDPSNASRTLLFDLARGRFDPALLEWLRIPPQVLPRVVDSSGVVGEAAPDWFGAALPIAGLAGDQQAALFGQGCFAPGAMKCTFGTGSFLLMNTGPTPKASRHRLLTTVAWRRRGVTTYALEGTVFVSGSAIQWLRDRLGVIASAAEVEPLAASVRDSAGVVFVPALAGLGAPHWDMAARGAIFGLTRGVTKAHLARATLEAMAFQTRDVVDCMAADAKVRAQELCVDGGAVRNDLLCQLLADLVGVPVVRPREVETTALGAAWLAGLGVGFWKDERELASLGAVDRRFEPAIARRERDDRHAQWLDAVARVKTGARR